MRTPTEIRAALTTLQMALRDDEAPPPWYVAVGADEWVVGVDGRLIVAFRRALVDGELPVVPARLVNGLTRWLTPVPSDRVLLQASELMAFVGFNDPPFDCSACNNTGHVVCPECDGNYETECECRECGHEHVADCDNCHEGEAACDECAEATRPMPVSLLGAIVDARRLRTALRVVLPDANDALSVSLTENRTAYVLTPAEHRQWRIVLMGMVEDTEPIATFQQALAVDGGSVEESTSAVPSKP